MYDTVKVYYGLTENEAKKVYVKHPNVPGVTGKGVHLSLDGLRRFVRDLKLSDVTYYTEVPITHFEVLKDVYMDPKYNMVAVKTPFTVMIKDVKRL